MILDITEAQLRRVVDGAVADALKMHSEYATAAGRRWLASSVAKRLAGSLKGFAAEAAGSRSGKPTARDGGGLSLPS